MQILIRGSLFLMMAGTIIGCRPGTGGSSTAISTTQTASKSWVLQSGGTNDLRLTAPVDFKCVTADGSLHFTGPQFEVEVWLVSGAKTVNDAVATVPAQIISEFKDFKPDQATDLTVAGSSARQLIGVGHEADDGDPGDADVIVFKVGDHVFVGCNHGESLTPAGQQGLLSLVQTAQVP